MHIKSLLHSFLNTTPSDWLTKVHIRHVEEGDLIGLEWEGEFQHFRRLYKGAYQRSLQGLSVLWVAELPGKGLIGQVFIQLIGDRPELADGKNRAYMYSFRVRPEYRSRGLGARILAFLEEDLKQRGFRAVTLNVAKDNPRAIKLYEKNGYRITAHEPGVWSYPDDRGIWRKVVEPAWRMEKFLTPD